MSRLPFILGLILLAVAGYTAKAGSGGSPGGGEKTAGKVLRVVDGDTIHVGVGGQDERVR